MKATNPTGRSGQTAALELALPLLREQLREIVESCLTCRPAGPDGFIRRRLLPDELEWIGPWRDAVTAVEIALGLPPSNDDGGVRYLDERQGNDG
jgi:hypothetical protein